MKTKVIPLTIAANWNHLRIKYLSNVPGMNDITELQKMVILSAAHIICKVLMYKNKTFIMGKNITFTVP
jgi:hypothetical protein